MKKQRNTWPLHFSIRISAKSFLPVTVYERLDLEVKRNKRKESNVLEKNDGISSENNQDLQSNPPCIGGGILSQQGIPVPETDWFGEEQEKNLYQIMKPFLKNVLFSQIQATKKKKLNEKHDSYNKNNSDKKKKKNQSKDVEKKDDIDVSLVVDDDDDNDDENNNNNGDPNDHEKKQLHNSNESYDDDDDDDYEIETIEFIKNKLATNRTMRIIRGDCIQFTYQFKKSQPLYYFLTRNERYERKDKVKLLEFSGGGDDKIGKESSNPITIPDGDDSDDDNSGDNGGNSVIIEDNKEHTTSSDGELSQTNCKSQSNTSINAEDPSYASKFDSLTSFPYSLVIYIEPFNDAVKKLSDLQDRELISYYVKKQ